MENILNSLEIHKLSKFSFAYLLPSIIEVNFENEFNKLKKQIKHLKSMPKNSLHINNPNMSANSLSCYGIDLIFSGGTGANNVILLKISESNINNEIYIHQKINGITERIRLDNFYLINNMNISKNTSGEISISTYENLHLYIYKNNNGFLYFKFILKF